MGTEELRSDRGELIRTIEYRGETLYLVPELKHKDCRGCCLEAEWLELEECVHHQNLHCTRGKHIAIRDLEAYKVAAVTATLTGEDT